MIEVIIGCSVLVIIIIFVMVSKNNKFCEAIIKINEAECNLDVLLERKLDLLQRTIPIIKKEIKLEDFLEDINEFDISSLNHFQSNDILKRANNELFKVLDEHEKLFKSENLSSILRDLSDNEEAIIGSIKFYNDNVVVFNQLVSSFPAKIVAFFHHYKRKDFYNDESKEIYELLDR